MKNFNYRTTFSVEPIRISYSKIFQEDSFDQSKDIFIIKLIGKLY